MTEKYVLKDTGKLGILNLKPNYNITFHRGNEKVGVLDFNGPEMTFSGDMDESAKLFLEFIATSFKTRLEQERAVGYREGHRAALAQRKPLTDEEIWVLTSEYNDYDQHGEYFEAIFIGKPTSKQIQKHCHVTEQGAVHILNGGGRVKYEDQWYNLRKEKAAHGIKGEA